MLWLGATRPPDVGVTSVVDGCGGGLQRKGDELIDAPVPVRRRQVDVDRHLAHKAFPNSDARAQRYLKIDQGTTVTI